MSRFYMFDAYGTLFDVHSAVMRAGQPLGAQAEAFSALWRVKQLEYTWIYTMTGSVNGQMFDVMTARALDFCLAKFGINPPGLREALLAAYQVLDAYPDVKPCLASLQKAGHKTAIFTNGTRKMVDAAIAAAGLGPLLDHVITVEATGRFKPDMAVYAHARAEIGNPPPESITFVSSNRWDVAASKAAGFTPIWINRTRQPSEYPELMPIAERSSLEEIGAI